MMENDLEDHPMATVKYNATTNDVNISMSMSIGNYFASTCAFVSSPKKTKPGQYLPLHPNRDQTMVIFRPYYETKVFSKGLDDVGFGYVTPGITDPDIFELPDFCM
ncbi:hypothetical protein SNE40_012000 [Patella caerulea]|uniref:Uncharacterized protein n=1 Tax=Patella caerulea TaxID=87958 RepID=A0AAN8JN30_PATCE